MKNKELIYLILLLSTTSPLSAAALIPAPIMIPKQEIPQATSPLIQEESKQEAAKNCTKPVMPILGKKKTPHGNRVRFDSWESLDSATGKKEKKLFAQKDSSEESDNDSRGSSADDEQPDTSSASDNSPDAELKEYEDAASQALSIMQREPIKSGDLTAQKIPSSGTARPSSPLPRNLEKVVEAASKFTAKKRQGNIQQTQQYKELMNKWIEQEMQKAMKTQAKVAIYLKDKPSDDLYFPIQMDADWQVSISNIHDFMVDWLKTFDLDSLQCKDKKHIVEEAQKCGIIIEGINNHARTLDFFLHRQLLNQYRQQVHDLNQKDVTSNATLHLLIYAQDRPEQEDSETTPDADTILY